MRNRERVRVKERETERGRERERALREGGRERESVGNIVSIQILPSYYPNMDHNRTNT